MFLGYGGREVTIQDSDASKTSQVFLHVSFNGAKYYRRSTFAKRFPSREIMTERYDLSKFGDLSSTYSNSLKCRLSSSTNVKLSNYGNHARLKGEYPSETEIQCSFSLVAQAHVCEKNRRMCFPQAEIHSKISEPS